jgi:hypothetical protein
VNAAHRFVADRGAIPIQELAAWVDRSARYVYCAIGRGDLRMFGPGKVTADSVLSWYASFDKHDPECPEPLEFSSHVLVDREAMR